jgi:DNA primase
MDKFEIQKLRDIPIVEVAQRLGLQVNSRRMCLCPFHDDHHPSMALGRKNHYRCFVCDAHGDVIDLVMRFLNKTFTEACRWLGDESNRTLPPAPPYRAGSNYLQEKVDFDASRYERFFERPWLSPEARRFLFDERHLDERVVRWCRLTSWKDRQEVPWLQIPYYDEEGRLVGVQNRNLVKGALPRFRFPQGSECGIYNLPILKRLKPGDELWIAEGCSDCWALLSAGHKAIAIPSATLLSKKDKDLLSSLSSSSSFSFHMYPDQDAPGERLFLQLQKVLPSLEHHQLPEGCKDFSEYYINPSPSPPRGRV